MMDEKFSQKLSNFYSAFVWPDDPENERGKEYFETAVKFMCTLTKHRWIKKMLSEKEKISILEVSRHHISPHGIWSGFLHRSANPSSMMAFLLLMK